MDPVHFDKPRGNPICTYYYSTIVVYILGHLSRDFGDVFLVCDVSVVGTGTEN